MKKNVFLLILAGIWLSSFAQTSTSKIDKIYLTTAYSNLSFTHFIQKIEQNYPVHFYYNDSDFPNFQISFNSDSIVLKSVLTEHLLPYNVFVSQDKKGNIFLNKNTIILTHFSPNFFNEKASKEEDKLEIDLKNKYEKTNIEDNPKSIVIGTRAKGINKYTATLRGKAINAETGLPIEGATIVDLESGKGAVTDDKGNYDLNLKIGKHNLKISSVNIEEKKIEVDLQSEGTLDLALHDKIIILPDLVISSERNQNIKGTQMGLDKIITKNVKKIPLVFGEKDIIKIAMLLPGVQTVGEGSSGFNVRGSPTDQNLFYINHVPIYNTAHLSGFFSAFNADVIDEFSLFKSNVPLQYGGRISSFFDIKTKNGSKDKTTARGGIGLITGRLTVEGPLKKEKSSFLVGVRTTYSDWILQFINDPIVKNSKANFADAVLNFSFQLNEYNRLNVFSYLSNDFMDLHTQSKYDYQNIGGSMAWQHFFKNQNSFELSLAHSTYLYNEENSQNELVSYTHSNELGHTEFKAILDVLPSESHHIQFGINSVLYEIDRGSYGPLTAMSYIENTNLGKEKGIESGLFISDEWKTQANLTFSGGIRYNLFTYFGPQEVNKYIDGLPFENENISEVLHFKNWEAIKTYQGLDFRIAANYLFNENMSVKASYNRLHQFIYMLNNTIAVSPDYKWKLVDYNTKPIVGDQITLGFYANLWKKKYEISIETYTKFSQNIVEIKDGANIIFNAHSEQATLQGIQNAYGVELMLKKVKGDLSGWLNYTYSNSTIIVDSPFPENRINFGKAYPSNYDKPHAFNMVVNYDFTRRTSISGNVVYATGRPITYPASIYYYDGIPSLSYSGRNAYRLPDYFRVDLSFNFEGNLLKRKLGHGTWALSVYNLLGRKNPYSVYFQEENGLIQAYKLSIFGAPIYSVTYNFKLGNYASE